MNAGFRIMSPCAARHLDYYFDAHNLPADMKFYLSNRVNSTRAILNHSGILL